MSDYVKVSREVAPGCRLPEDVNTPAWRYMDFSKLESLIKKRAFYLCRADRLEDRFEGTYSRHQIVEMEQWFRKIGEPEMIEIEKNNRRRDRERTYLSCWCLGECDFELMWKVYVRNPPGIAVKSTVDRLRTACDDALDHWPLDISVVTYFDHAGGENINHFGTPAVFLHKDHHFSLDNELRIIHWPNMSEPTPDHAFLPVKIAEVIEEIVLQPGSNEKDVESVMSLLEAAELKDIPVRNSRDDREHVP